MRNPLKRRVPTGPAKPSLRTRLAGAKTKLVAAKEKYGRTLRVHRAVNTPPAPKPEPTERIALINYATWLFYERRLVCRDLYPEAGLKAANVVHGDVAAEHFHFPRGPKGPEAAADPSARAIATLDALGIDWRRDRDESIWGEEEPGNAPAAALPHGWPKADAELTEALGDLRRLDLAIEALGTYGPNDDRELEDLSAWDDLDGYRDAALERLAKVRAKSLSGLQAKAHALLTQTVSDQGTYSATGVNAWVAIAESLARDLLGAHSSVFDQRRADPILAAIEETTRLAAVVAATFTEWPHDTSEPADLIARRDAATSALWDYARGTLFKTVPTTARGCAALARYASAFLKEQGADWNDEAPAFLGLIAASPLLA